MPSNPINKDTEGARDSVCIKRVSIKQGWTVVHKKCSFLYLLQMVCLVMRRMVLKEFDQQELKLKVNDLYIVAYRVSLI